MKRTVLLLCVAATTVFWSRASAESADSEIVSAPAAASKLELRGLAVGSDGGITGSVFNGSGVAIKDVELLVSHVWSWNDERHPGENNPGRSSYIRVAGEIPASGSIPFSYKPEPPLPTRTDGNFETTAAVQSFTEIEN
jgi:hypothetical protein